MINNSYISCRNRFYKIALEKTGFFSRIASAFCQGHAGRVCQNYSIYQQNIEKDRISDISLKFYSDESLHGFADINYKLRGDGKPLLEQQRSLIIPLVENQIQKINPIKKILEIGTGNGDVLAYLAKKYSNLEFFGVDLSVSNAIKKHNLPNLYFVEGYALDLLMKGKISGDIVFGSSTFCIFTPKEFVACLNAIKATKGLVISEPLTFGYKHTKDTRAISRHMDLYMWWHNYYGYLHDQSFEIDTYQTVPFSYSHSPNCEVVLISGYR